MNLFYVYQGITYKDECERGYLWSPQTNKIGHANIGFSTMTKVKVGDLILHGCKRKTLALSVASTNCCNKERPIELRNKDLWNDIGYMVKSKYVQFTNYVDMAVHEKWLEENYKKESAFTKAGQGKQQYLCVLDKEHAVYLLKQALKLEQDIAVKSVIQENLIEILAEKKEFFDKICFNDSFEELVESSSVVQWKGVKKEKGPLTQNGLGKNRIKRDSLVAVNALTIAGYKCEYDELHKTFMRKNGKCNYTESHHLVPLRHFEMFDYSLDVEENIVSLCSHCHNLLHYGRSADKSVILKQLFNIRREALYKVGICINSFEELMKLYE